MSAYNIDGVGVNEGGILRYPIHGGTLWLQGQKHKMRVKEVTSRRVETHLGMPDGYDQGDPWWTVTPVKAVQLLHALIREEQDHDHT